MLHSESYLIIKNSRKAHEWVCESCHFKELPFSGLREFHEITATSPTRINSIDCENIHILNLKSHGKHLSIGNLNKQSMVSLFDEFNVMLQEHPFDILTLSEKWLKDDVTLLNNVQILGYKFSYRNRNERRGGVGLYIKDSIKYKVRHDLNKIDESIEHLWMECKGNNCNKSYLVAALYQPSSSEKEKLIWIEKLDTLLSIVNSTWNKTITITGDTNIDYLKPSAALKRYEEVIETYNLKQHIDITTRKGAKIIDDIITNLKENKLITTNVLPCPTVSDHDAPYIITNIPGIKFQTRTKYIRNMKHFNIKDFVDDFKTLPLALVYSFEDSNEQLEKLNNLILECIERHTPLVKTKFTHPPAPWMKQLDIAELQKNGTTIVF